MLVFGSGISGEGSCRLLLEKGADVVLYDGNEKLCADEIEAKILETKKEITRKEVESVLNCSKFTAINLINELLKENVLPYGDLDFIKSIATRFIAKMVLPSSAQCKRLLKIVSNVEDKGFVMP